MCFVICVANCWLEDRDQILLLLLFISFLTINCNKLRLIYLIFCRNNRKIKFFKFSNFRKDSKFVVSIERQKAKSVSARSPFDLAPEPRWGHSPQTLIPYS